MAVEITLKGGQKIRVDKCDVEALGPESWHIKSWWVNSRGYVVRTRPRKEKLHRLIMERVLGRKLKPFEQVDHINQDKLDCARDNLRLATHAENMRNRGANGNRQYKGVYRAQCEKESYVAKITYEGEQMYLGTFPTPEKAAKAYDKACVELHGDFAALNYPGEHHELH